MAIGRAVVYMPGLPTHILQELSVRTAHFNGVAGYMYFRTAEHIHFKSTLADRIMEDRPFHSTGDYHYLTWSEKGSPLAEPELFFSDLSRNSRFSGLEYF